MKLSFEFCCVVCADQIITPAETVFIRN